VLLYIVRCFAFILFALNYILITLCVVRLIHPSPVVRVAISLRYCDSHHNGQTRRGHPAMLVSVCYFILCVVLPLFYLLWTIYLLLFALLGYSIHIPCTCRHFPEIWPPSSRSTQQTSRGHPNVGEFVRCFAFILFALNYILVTCFQMYFISHTLYGVVCVCVCVCICVCVGVLGGGYDYRSCCSSPPLKSD
jgi:hypothetical protein